MAALIVGLCQGHFLGAAHSKSLPDGDGQIVFSTLLGVGDYLVVLPEGNRQKDDHHER